MTGRLEARQREHGDRVLGTSGVGSFHADRARLLESVGREAQRVVETSTGGANPAQIADAARTAVAATAALGAGALGLRCGRHRGGDDGSGGRDWTARGRRDRGGRDDGAARRQAARPGGDAPDAFDLRARLASALRGEFTAASAASRQRLVDAIGPYTRFVRSEQARWAETRETLQTLRARIGTLLTRRD